MAPKVRDQKENRPLEKEWRMIRGRGPLQKTTIAGGKKSSVEKKRKL